MTESEVLLAVGSGFWTGPHIAGLLIIGSMLVPLAVSIPFYVRGDIRAVEAQFRPIEVAVGNVPVLRVASALSGPWYSIILVGFTVLALELIERGNTIFPVLSVVLFLVFTVTALLESAFHTGVTVWAVRKLEDEEPVPELFHELKGWLNVHMQWMANPLAFLAFIGFGIAFLQTELIADWASWVIIGWSGLWFFIPFPLALFPVPIFMGIMLLLSG